MFDVSGQVVVITGATRGIGRAIADQMALKGARVVISSRKPDACDAVAAEINKMTAQGAGEAVAIPCNISYKDQLKALVDKTLEKYGQIDTLVCNAAANVYFGPSATIPDEAFEKTIDTNIKANHWICQMALPHMAKRKKGSVIFISSIGGLKGTGTLGTYAITKAAEMALSRNIAVEYGPQNIRANTIAPGLIKTEFSRALWEDPENLKLRLSQSPLRRLGLPEDIAGAVVFLASEAASFMTGQVLVIDGGITV